MIRRIALSIVLFITAARGAEAQVSPPRGATDTVGLIPWEQGSGGPARVFADW